MTEPQELRSIDELFRNTFNNLPDTPSESGWDTPSEQVWKHVSEQIKAPGSAWNLKSRMTLSNVLWVLGGSLSVAILFGLYYAYVKPADLETKPKAAEPPTATSVETPAPAQENSVRPTEIRPEVSTPAATQRKIIPQLKKPSPPVNPVLLKPVNSRVETPRSSGAAPLPGTNGSVKPNTREERKAEHARQLEQKWKTPVELLPLRGTRSVRQ